MFTVPSDYTIEKIVITPESVGGELPKVSHNKQREPLKLTYKAPEIKGKTYA